MVKVLIENGADMNLAINGVTPLQFSIGVNADPKIVKLLMEHGATDNQDTNGDLGHFLFSYGGVLSSFITSFAVMKCFNPRIMFNL